MQTNNKLREAVVEIINYLEPIRKWTMPSKENHTKLTALFAAVDTVYTKANNALAEPVKNCEVGTVKEQNVRYNKFCHAHRSSENCCGGCPLNGESCCELA
jgi:hypothetical protein